MLYWLFYFITVLQCQSITVLPWLCGPAMPFCCDTKTVHRLLPCSPPLWHVSSIWWYWYINIHILILILICQYYYIEIDLLWASLDNCFSTTPHSSGAIQLVPKIIQTFVKVHHFIHQYFRSLPLWLFLDDLKSWQKLWVQHICTRFYFKSSKTENV